MRKLYQVSLLNKHSTRHPWQAAKRRDRGSQEYSQDPRSSAPSVLSSGMTWEMVLFVIFCLLLPQFSFANDTIQKEKELVEEKFIHAKKKSTLQILNKITAKSQYLEIPVNTRIVFSTLRITVFSCWKASPYDLVENKILLNVEENKGGNYSTIFNGWMFSSSPAISSLEHSVYDLVAINCED